MRRLWTVVFYAAIATAWAQTAGAQEDLPSREEMWQIIQSQQSQINDLTSRLDNTQRQTTETQVQVEQTQQRLEETDDKVEATADLLESDDYAAGIGWWDRTSIGAYGELHYNGGMTDEIDLHRFVVFLGHEFTDDIRMAGEIEYEHNVTGGSFPGEVEIEQAFVEFDLFDDTQQARAGVMLVPVGILNQTHEPPTFFGVERNRVEGEIIPTTWWEAGVGASGQIIDGFSYDAMVHSGLAVPTTGGSAFRIRSGRQKVAEAIARDPAFTGRIRWTGLPGVEIGVAGQYQADITQSALGVDAFLIEAHTDINYDGFGLRALFAQWNLWGTPAEVLGKDLQYGWYVEPSYTFGLPEDFGELGFFVRYEAFDTTAGDSIDSGIGEFSIGANYWPIPEVVMKADFQWQMPPDGMGLVADNRLDLGVGWQF